MAGELYKKPILFAIVATVVILIGTVVTMFVPMLTAEMHPKLENLKPYTALQLAGKDIYQREGCNNCHTQTVRPLKTEVMRYGEYSKAGEFAYDRPFLWGSKRTGPDLARIGGKYPDQWHEMHFDNPQSMYAESNMPAYGWLKQNKLDPESIESHMKVNDFPYTEDELARLKDKTELDALIAYMQAIGAAIPRKAAIPTQVGIKEKHTPNPLAGDAAAITEGEALYKQHCASCHGEKGQGGIGPSLTDNIFLDKRPDLPDDDYFEVTMNGTQPGSVEDGRPAKGGMPAFATTLNTHQGWAVVTYIRSISGVKYAAKEKFKPNPLAGDAAAVQQGETLYKKHCSSCHGGKGEGGIGPSLIDNAFLYQPGDLPDNDYFEITMNGTQTGAVEGGRTGKGGMPAYAKTLQKNEIWAVVTYIRALQGKQ